jgi:hypothetical protein
MTNDKFYVREEYLKKKAAENRGLNIQLTNNYAFRKTFKNAYIAKGFLMALLGLNEEEIVDLEVTDPFEEEKTTELYYWAKLLAAKDWKEVDDTIKGNPYGVEALVDKTKMPQGYEIDTATLEEIIVFLSKGQEK